MRPSRPRGPRPRPGPAPGPGRRAPPPPARRRDRARAPPPPGPGRAAARPPAAPARPPAREPPAGRARRRRWRRAAHPSSRRPAAACTSPGPRPGCRTRSGRRGSPTWRARWSSTRARWVWFAGGTWCLSTTDERGRQPGVPSTGSQAWSWTCLVKLRGPSGAVVPVQVQVQVQVLLVLVHSFPVQSPAPSAGAVRRTPPRFVQELDTLIRARYPLVYLVTSEEQRLEAILAELAQGHGKALLGWSVARGFRRLDGQKAVPEDGKEPIRDPVAALARIEKLSEPVAGGAEGLPRLPRRPGGGAQRPRAGPRAQVHLHHGHPALAHAGHAARDGEGGLGPRRAAPRRTGTCSSCSGRSWTWCAGTTAPRWS